MRTRAIGGSMLPALCLVLLPVLLLTTPGQAGSKHRVDLMLTGHAGVSLTGGCDPRSPRSYAQVQFERGFERGYLEGFRAGFRDGTRCVPYCPKPCPSVRKQSFYFQNGYYRAYDLAYDAGYREARPTGVDRPHRGGPKHRYHRPTGGYGHPYRDGRVLTP